MLTARGGIDMTATAPGYNPDQLRYWRAFQTPLIFKDTKQVIEVLEKVVEEFPAYRGEMDKIGVVWLFQQPLGEYYLSGSSPACAAIADLKGKRQEVSAPTFPRPSRRSVQCRSRYRPLASMRRSKPETWTSPSSIRAISSR